MRLNATIFVEGKSDRAFLIEFFRVRFNLILNQTQFILTNGKTNLDRFVQEFNISTDQGLANLVVFDADDSFSGTNQSLNDQKRNLGIQFEHFLFPDNAESGNLEVLLEVILSNPNNRFVFDCFGEYLDCMQKKSGKKLKKSAFKSRIFAYNEYLKPATHFGNDSYSDPDLWDFGASKLDRFANFFKPFIIE